MKSWISSTIYCQSYRKTRWLNKDSIVQILPSKKWQISMKLGLKTWNPRMKGKIFNSCQEIEEIPQEKEKGRLRLQCHRGQRGKCWSSPSTQKILQSNLKLQSFYEQLQRSTCNGKAAQTKEKEAFQELWKEQQGIQCSNKKFQKFVRNKKRRKT